MTKRKTWIFLLYTIFFLIGLVIRSQAISLNGNFINGLQNGATKIPLGKVLKLQAACPGCCDGIDPYCVPNDANCPSDGWVCNPGNIRAYRDYYCRSDCSCGYTDSSQYDCDNSDRWVNKGSPYSCCRPGTQEACTCQDQEYRDYSCSAGSCTYIVTNTRTVYSSCTNCNNFDTECRDYYCSAGSCAYTNMECGFACTNGICDGSGNCYTGAGSQTACSGVLDCSIPIPPPGYTRDLTGSCNRPGGTYKRSGTGVCDLASCVQTPSYTDPIQGGWTSIEYPSSTYTYKITDIIQVKVRGVWATAGFVPLLECRLNKTDKNGNPAGGIEFDAWVSGPFPKDVTFSYTVKSTDPSGYWSIDYCVLVTDFYINKGWTLQSDWAKHICCVSTELVAG